MIGAGVHINAIGGDCPGKTELHRDILLRADTFVEYPPQTRIEGEIQQMEPELPCYGIVEGHHRAGAGAPRYQPDHPIRQRGFRDRGFFRAPLRPRQAQGHRALPGPRHHRRPRRSA